jgi:hypothetical protein
MKLTPFLVPIRAKAVVSREKRRINLHNCGSNPGKPGDIRLPPPEPTAENFANSGLTLQSETPLLKAILEYHKKYETALRASCFEFQLLVVCT